MRCVNRRRTSHGSHRGRMAVHRLGCDLHHLGLCHNLGYENFRRTMASRYGCENGESDGRVIVPRTLTVYETTDDSFGPPDVLLGTPGFHDAQIFAHDDGKIRRLSDATVQVWGSKLPDVACMEWRSLPVIRQSLNTHGYYVLLADSRMLSQATTMRDFLCAH